MARLGAGSARLGVAVSGGPDSLALLLLAAAARPGAIEAATVDHGLRPESAAEAEMVVALCAELGVPHAVLKVEVAPGNLQQEARLARYRALAEWQQARGIDILLTAHHADDQAETLLMRLNRGSGLGGLAGVRSRGSNPASGGIVLRPLLGWRKEELERIVRDCGVAPARDPSNEDDRFDRARIRKALAAADWLDPAALAQSAAWLADAEAALEHYAQSEWETQVDLANSEIRYCPEPTAPREIRLRVLARALERLGGQPRLSQVAELLDVLERGEGANLAGVLARAEKGLWVLRPEPPRR
ncbi:tRNA lysidine(34) synthetase TilS [Altererythrobacter litoralis]|uniref:tRNA(Ile)-lysidine synthase n=1 Tax=Altererythrobacter litoralis TaxID=3113904 RepID=A0ABU7GH90_9SPHN|nr:tRNA lysidine(34) synthetase TilS [Erythrobacteraceae bacterium 1XM1-14]